MGKLRCVIRLGDATKVHSSPKQSSLPIDEVSLEVLQDKQKIQGHIDHLKSLLTMNR